MTHVHARVALLLAVVVATTSAEQQPSSCIAFAAPRSDDARCTDTIWPWMQRFADGSSLTWLRKPALRQRRRLHVGSLYVGRINLPILGEQTFMMRIVSRSVLRITLIGAMNLDELAPFREEASESEGTVRRLSVAFNEPTRALLRRYRTRIRSTTYHEDGDYGMLEICPLFLPTIRVKMSRVR